MRFINISLSAICLAFCLFTTSAVAADVAKIGVIDLQKILNTSDAGKDAQAKINAKGQTMQEDLQTKAAEYTETQERYDREASVMSSEARSEKERELKIKQLDLEDLKEKYESEFSAYNQELVNLFKVGVLKASDEIGKKEGYTLILEKSSGGIVYAPSTIDITDKVIQQYNENYAKEQ
jgi:outer membrane protein